jgi:hypothetical protein
MSGNTTRANLPYPTGTDKVRFGASAIQNLAQTLDPMVLVTLPAPLASASLVDAYPIGLSTFVMSGAQATADGGWPRGQAGVVFTDKPTTDRAMQFWSLNSATVPEVWFRQITTTANTPWALLGGNVYRIHNGTSTVALASGTWSTVNFPTMEANAGDIVPSGNGLVVTTPGLYRADIMINWTTAIPNTGVVTVGVAPLAASQAGLFYRTSGPGGNAGFVQSGSFLVPMVQNDTLAVWVLQQSGASQSIGNRRFSLHRVSS